MDTPAQPDDSSALVATSRVVPISRGGRTPALGRALSDQQTAFVNFYLGVSKFNAMDAASRAGYKDPQQSAYDCKIHPGVRAEIDARLEAVTLTAPEVLFHLAEIANAPLEYFMQIQRHSFTDPVSHEVYPAIMRLDYSSKVRALETLARAYGLLANEQRQDVSVKVVVGIDLDKLV